MADNTESLNELLTDGVKHAIRTTIDVAKKDAANDADRLRASTVILRIAGLLDGDNRPDPEQILADATDDELREQLEAMRAQRTSKPGNDLI